MVDEEVWKKRFLLFTLVRLSGLAMVLLGAAIGYTNLLREGGWPVVGTFIGIMGLIDAVFAPKLLRKAWAEEDQQQQ